MIVKLPWLLRFKGWLAGVEDVRATTIGPITIVGEEPLTQEQLTHERIHHSQWVECFGVGYVALFWYWYLRGRAKGLPGHQAYEMVPFELEAYDNQHNENYPATREPFAWWEYR